MDLVTLGTGVKYLKAGFLGFSKSGKTYTAAKLAIGTRKKLELKGPIALWDSEAAAQYVAPEVKKQTGLDLVGVQARDLASMIEFIKACIRLKVSVAIIDSVTHPWREVCKSFLEQKNDALVKRRKSPQAGIEFQDWKVIKEKWAVFTDLYINCPLHIIICGRAGFQYEFQERSDGSGKDLVTTGIKMKTETEFGFEPSLLVEMERIQVDPSGKIQAAITHRATVIGDRFSVIDGQTKDNPDFEFFEPYVNMLTGDHVTVDTERQTDLELNEEAQGKSDAARKHRAIVLEEIQNLMVKEYPGQAAPDKKAKVVIFERAAGTSSWEAIKSLPIDGLESIRSQLPVVIQNYRAELIEEERVEAEKKAKDKKEKKGATK